MTPLNHPTESDTAAPGAAALERFAKPHPIDDVTLVFPAGVGSLMPLYSEVPDEFTSQRNPWVKWQRQWFYSGLKSMPTPKDGINVRAAMRHLSAIQGSYEPKHEHKEAAVAYLAAQWFKDDGSPPAASGN